MYRQILVPVDGSEASRLGLDEAIKIAKGLGAKICIVHVVNEFVPVSIDMAASAIDVIGMLRELGETLLENTLKEVRAQGVDVEGQLLEAFGGHASDAILRHATERRPDLIAMGTHGRRGVRRLVLGSDAENVVRGATVPVLLIRAGSDGK